MLLLQSLHGFYPWCLLCYYTLPIASYSLRSKLLVTKFVPLLNYHQLSSIATGSLQRHGTMRKGHGEEAMLHVF